jgi:hypothetical protein
MIEPSLRCGYPIALTPRRIVTDVLLVAAFKFGHPVMKFIQMVIDDLSVNPR